MEKDDIPSSAPTTPADGTPRMSFDADQIDELRKRLYSRGGGETHSVRHQVPPRVHAVPEATPVPPPAPPKAVPPIVHTPLPAPAMPTSGTIEEMPRNTKRIEVRKKIAVGGLVFFVAALLISTVLMFWGGYAVSGDNISITTSGNPAVGGGEEYEFQVAIANQNTVPIQSATLFVQYPDGTHSAAEPDKEISLERRPLDRIESSELVNVPLEVRMYGEEGEAKEIKIWLEYRVGGSNATFEKHADPLKFTITTSPITLRIDTKKDISSGQEIELTLEVASNSEAPLTNMILKAFYPEGFDFTASDPDTLSGEDTWEIEELEPGERKTVVIRGLLTGGEEDVRRFGAAVGVPQEDNGNNLASQLATANAEITIEQPSLDVEVVINGSPIETVVVNSATKATVEINYENELNSSIHNGKVTVALSGSALSDYRVETFGDYNESKNTITWDFEDSSELREILPGSDVEFRFALEPKSITRRTPEVRMEVKVEGGRTSGDREAQSLHGSASRILKIEGTPDLSSKTNFTEGPFTNTGPIPPEVGEVTQYTYLITARAGVNDLTAAEMTAILPSWVSWLDLVTPNDTVTFNPTTRTMKWTIGNINAREEAAVGIQVSVVPEGRHEGEILTILETQRFKATDRFTGTTVRSDAPALTTNLEGGSSSDARVR